LHSGASIYWIRGVPPAEELYAQCLQLQRENAALRIQLDWMRRQLFGGPKSEKLDRAQLALQLGELPEAKSGPQPARTVSYERPLPAAPRQAPAEAFASLPVDETVVIEPEEAQAAPELYERIGEERTFEVDIVPPRLFKRELVRPKYRLKASRSSPPLCAPAPARPVAGGYASAGLLAWIAIAKYVDHLPLHRIERMTARWGAEISRQSMADWMEKAAFWLGPLRRAMLQGLLDGGYLQADETPVRCNDPGAGRGSTFQGYFWVVSRPGGDVVFGWRESRRHAELPSLIGEGFRGLLQGDGYEAYDAYARGREGVVRVGCWAHARRRFFEAAEHHRREARWFLERIAGLYRLEREWDGAGIGPEERRSLRRARFAGPLRWMRRVAIGMRARALPNSTLGKACDYLLNQWDSLAAHLEHGQTRLDTNLVENEIRPSAVGKKNWLFIGHPNAGERSAIIYSIVASCRRRGIDPLAYIRDVLSRLPAMSSADDLTPLLPANWKPAAKA
jgi:transposase